MSYDLYYCRREDTPAPQLDAVMAFLETIPHLKIKKRGRRRFEAFYHHENTGVYFALGTDPPKGLPPGFVPAGLSFNLNYVRPHFFALEAMPIAVSIAENLGLLVVDPQDHEIGGKGLPKEPQMEELVSSWEKGNLFAVRALRAGGEELAYMPGAYAEAWWDYMRRYDEFQKNFGEKAFVPKIMLARRKGERMVARVVVWMQGAPQVIPQCDYFLVAEGEKFDPRAIKAWFVPTSSFLARLEGFLASRDDLSGCRLFLPSGQVEIDRSGGMSPEEFEGVAPDGFVDVEEGR